MHSPRVVLAETHQEKLATINEIFRSYLEKDIVYLLRVEKSDSFSNLVRLLASQTGKMVSYSANCPPPWGSLCPRSRPTSGIWKRLSLSDTLRQYI